MSLTECDQCHDYIDTDDDPDACVDDGFICWQCRAQNDEARGLWEAGARRLSDQEERADALYREAKLKDLPKAGGGERSLT